MNNCLAEVLKKFRKTFLHLVVFSFIINILSLALPIYSLQVLDRVLGSSSIETLMYLSAIVFLMLICMNFLNFIRDTAFNYIASSFEESIQDRAFTSCFNIHSHRNSTQNMNDMSTIKTFIINPQLTTMFDTPWVIIFLSVIFYIHIIPGTVVLFSAIILVLITFMNTKLLTKYAKNTNEGTIVLNNKTNLLIQNSEVVNAMKMQGNLLQRYLVERKKLKHLENELKTKQQHSALFIKTFRFTVQIAITIVSAILIIKGEMSAGAYIAISILSGKVLSPFDASAGIFTTLTNTKKAYNRLGESLQQETNSNKTKLQECSGGVSFENIFYVIDEKPLIKGISFKVNAGEIIGIIGRSGSGKTTIARLLSGVLLPIRGVVNINGYNLQNWQEEQLEKHIGYLPQNVELFHGTVKENIARMNTYIEDKHVLSATQITQTHQLISSLPNGYETLIMQDTLSAGQKQRIALARAFFGDVKIVILDEPNSNLDSEGEIALMQTILNAKKKGITVFIISHKPSILQITDKIMLIDSGTIKTFAEAKSVISNFTTINK